MLLRSCALVFAGLTAAVAFGCSAGDGGDPPPGSGTAANGGGGNGGGAAPGAGGGISIGSGGGIALPNGGGGGTNPECDNILEVTYRDFNESHPDMEMAFSGDVVRLTLLEPNLGPDRKPVFRDSIGCPPNHDDPTICEPYWQVTEPVITSAESFNQWYNTVEGVNIEIPGTLTLTEEAPGSGSYVFDSDSFFPLSPEEGFGLTPANGNHLGKNFLFTTEIHLRFTYRRGQVFTFRGDDDLWIFVNGKLAMDLGSMHLPAEGTIDFDAQAEKLGIAPGGSYAMDIFHAERHTTGSNFRFETNIACFEPGVVE